MKSETAIVVPPLKWAGGKRWLVQQYRSLFPSWSGNYIEPFFGSGAVFFHLSPRRAVLSDTNADLISTYRAIREDWKKVVATLAFHQKRHSKRHYYAVRVLADGDRFERAARFLYLNRTCWNGLYRVNLKGQFNVPIGTKSAVLLESDDFAEVAKRLRKAELLVADFEEVLDAARANDFAFIDPPYTANHNNNGFIKYNEQLFSWDDQVRLRDAVERAVRRGVRAMVTNADHVSVRKLYSGVGKLVTLTRNSVLAGQSSFRGEITELLVSA